MSGVAGLFIDPGVSAWHHSPILHRPAFCEIMKNARVGDRIVCTRLDRAFRSMKDFCETWPILANKGITMVFTQQNIDTSTAWGQCKAHIIAAFAQLKSDLISQRTIEGLAAKKAGIKMARTSRDMLRMEVDPLLRIDKVPSKDECENSRGRVFSYARCSSWDQSVASQMPQLHRMVDTAIEDGYTYGGTYADEGISAYSVAWQDRPAGSTLWKQLQPGDLICVSRVDRAFRSLSDLLVCYRELKEMDVGLRLEDENGDTRLHEDDECMLQIMVALAEMESKDISTRVSEGMAAAAAMRGKRISRSHCPWWQQVKTVHGKWRFVPNYDALAEYDEVLTLLDEGHTKVAASDIMEEKLSLRDRRLWIPNKDSGVYAPKFIQYKKKTYAEEWVRGFKRYATREKKMMSSWKEGYVRRPWSSKRISDRMRDQEEIEALYKESPEIHNRMMSRKDYD